VAVVGAGPAGLAAALDLHELGIDVVLVDEGVRPGGQIHRQPPATFAVEAAAHGPGHELPGRAEASALRRLQATVAWGVFGTEAPLDTWADGPHVDAPLALALAGPAGLDVLGADRLLLAPGAYDLPVAFPGWTLPGVMTAGGVQALLKSQRLLAGRRIVLAGAHPLLLIVAAQLLGAGAELAAVALAQARPGMREGLRDLAALRGDLSRLVTLVGPLARLRRSGVPLRTGTIVARAEGGERLERVRLAAVDTRWRVTHETDVVECDTLALGYGFVPSSELARQAGCAHRYDGPAGGWIVEHDEWQRSSLPAVFVAGELTGIGGAEQALEEGRLAALGLALDLGRLGRAEAERRAAEVRRRLARTRRFGALVQRRFAPRLDALAALATDETVVCRCESLTAGRLRAALAEHPHVRTLDALKLLTRAGMGPCQGRMCLPTATQLLCAARGAEPAAVGPYRARPPVKPIPLGALADLGRRPPGDLGGSAP
jgi:NADPH-dependent 2,4-dienoyl-CoA reductase/sulfur reductase-like enzyme